ncbi:MAG: nucleoside hydrolase [Hyphomicrobiales bacterium]|nr:MAG: nucleoside hydrolase [Hyphomicrobiales bacterium]
MTIQTHKIIIDTDPGIDDALAIQLAYADPRIDIVGMTTIFGNVYTHQATRNARHLAELAGHSTRVAEGVHKPYVQAPREPSHYVHGKEGYGDLDAPTPNLPQDSRTAAEFICAMADEHGKSLTLCPIGPLANIAHALDLDPDLPNKIGSVVIMGGAVTVPGNVTSHAEANIYNDPHAAERVFSSGLDVRLVGLDITSNIHCVAADFDEIGAGSPEIGGFLHDISEFYLRFYREFAGSDHCCLHDPAALMAITDPDLFTYEESPVTVLLEGEEAGNTNAVDDASRPAIRFATACNEAEIRNRFIERLRTADAVKAART